MCVEIDMNSYDHKVVWIGVRSDIVTIWSVEYIIHLADVETTQQQLYLSIRDI